MNVFTVKTKHGVTQWNLSPECKREIQPIADEFGMGIKRFLFLYTKDALPGQLVRRNDVDEENAPLGFSVSACADPTTWARVKRVAKHDGVSIKDYVWQAIASSANCCEADMILSPATGEPISSDCLIERFILASERQEI
jgi:hypothetical protein